MHHVDESGGNLVEFPLEGTAHAKAIALLYKQAHTLQVRDTHILLSRRAGSASHQSMWGLKFVRLGPFQLHATSHGLRVAVPCMGGYSTRAQAEAQQYTWGEHARWFPGKIS
eukprot:scaffold7315_cov18-Tisochrysis_lutea.AAC.2